MKNEKREIEQEIGRARDNVGQRIDELDRHLRKTLDFKSAVVEHAPEIVAGGAVVGFLVGFGFPKAIKLLLKVGIPIAAISFAAKKYASRNGEDYFTRT